MIAEVLFWGALSCIVYTYLLYPLLMFTLTSFVKEKVAFDPTYVPSISIVVSVYNEEGVLQEKLKNLASLDYPKEKTQFLFGSDGSTDNSNKILQSVNDPRMEVHVYAERRGKAIVLNDLIAKSNAEIIVFSDANTMFYPDTVKFLVSHLADSQVGGVSGELKLVPEISAVGTVGESSYWDYENYLKQMESDFHTALGATGAVYAIRRLLFKPLPTHKAVTDDLLIPLRIVEQGYRVKYERRARAIEASALSIGDEFRRKARIGAQNFATISDFASLLYPGKGFVAFALWSHKILRWCIPFMLLTIVILFPVLSSESELYRFFSLGGIAFLSVALVGFLLEKFRIDTGILALPYYFVAMNIALFVGFLRFLRGQERSTWNVSRS